MPHTAEGFPPQVGDRFTLLRELGRGGMATVFLAEDRKHNRQVAIKILHRELMEVLGPARFQREVAIAARLNHPHILTLIESGESGGMLWYAMPFVEGESLRARMERVGQFTVPDVLGIARQIAAALDYAHEQGVVHRDIKPENVMLSGDHAWVADFGIARLTQMEEGSPITSASLVVGTPQYMSPEQARGGTAALDGRVDVYALGCVVYEMLAGAPPFTAPSRETLLARHALDPVPPLRTVRGGVTVAAQEVIEKALAKSAADRYATAGAFVTALEKAFASRRTWTRGQVGVAAAVTIGVVLLVAVLTLWGPSAPDLEAHRVAVMPLSTRGQSGLSGNDIGLWVETGLNRTDTLIARYADAGLATPPSRWEDSTILRVGRSQLARYVLTGTVLTTDSVRAEIVLHDLVDDENQAISVAASLGIDDFQLGSRIVREALLFLLPTGGRREDRSVVSSDPAALADYLAAEQQYHTGAFAAADTFYTMALGHDPHFAWAAIRQAQAASWLMQRERASELARLALGQADSLPRRHAALARGIEAYTSGDAERALGHFREALALDSRWPEAWMALGEVWFHLMPSAGQPLDSAAAAFDAARRLDPSFAPPLIHQLEIAFWKGERVLFDSLDKRVAALVLDRLEEVTARMMRSCLRPSQFREAWRREAERAERADTLLEDVLGAAQWIAVGGASNWACAAAGFDAVRQADSTGKNAIYAQLGQASVLGAGGDIAGATSVLSEFLVPAARWELTVTLADAGLPLGAAADSAAAKLDARIRGPGPIAPAAAWAAGVGAIARGDMLLQRPLELLDSLSTAADSARQREARLYRQSLQARVLLARRDTAAAFQALLQLVPTGNQDVLRWFPWEALGWERLTLAQLLARRGQVQRAMDVAGMFDSPAAIGLVPWVPASLVLREKLALQLNDRARADALRARYVSLRGSSGSNPQRGR